MYKPLHLPLIEALPAILFPEAEPQLSLYEAEQQAVAHALITEPGQGGEWSIAQTVEECMEFNASKRHHGAA